MPAYNAEKYIAKCIKSVLRQTYTDFELIIVNDCSTDGTLRICQKFAEQDKRISILNKMKNEGVDKARYDGVQKAVGTWLMFVDADDKLPKAAVSALWTVTNEHDVDLVMGSIRLSAFGGIVRKDILVPKVFVGYTYNHTELMEKFYISFFGINNFSPSMCGKLYRTELVRYSFRPSNLRFGEDLVFNMHLFPLLRSAYFISEVVYDYQQGSGGTSQFMPYWIENVKLLYREKQQAMIAHGFTSQSDFFLKVELINCLRGWVESFLTFKRSTRKENIALLQEELQDDTYKELRGVKYHDPEIVASILAKDAVRLYARVEYQYQHASLKTKSMRMARELLRFFA